MSKNYVREYCYHLSRLKFTNGGQLDEERQKDKINLHLMQTELDQVGTSAGKGQVKFKRITKSGASGKELGQKENEDNQIPHA